MELANVRGGHQMDAPFRTRLVKTTEFLQDSENIQPACKSNTWKAHEKQVSSGKSTCKAGDLKTRLASYVRKAEVPSREVEHIDHV